MVLIVKDRVRYEIDDVNFGQMYKQSDISDSKVTFAAEQRY